MDENLILKDQIKQHEAMSADENQKLQRSQTDRSQEEDERIT